MVQKGSKSYVSITSGGFRSDKTVTKEGIEGGSSVSVKRLTPAEIQEKRRQNLCFNCDEKWNSGNKWKKKQAFILEGICMGDELEWGEHQKG